MATETTGGPEPSHGVSWLRRLQAHLERAEAELGTVRAGLEELRAALLANDAARLGGALRAQGRAAPSAREARRERSQFQQEMAAKLARSATAVNLSALLDQLPAAAAAALAPQVARVRQLADEADALHREIAALTYYGLEFLDRFFGELTGTPEPARYAPGGKRRPAAGAAVLELRG